MKSLLFILIWGSLFIGNIFGQSPYQLDWKNELYYLGGGLGTLGLGAYLQTKTTPFTIDELERFNSASVNSFDRNATNNYSLSAQTASDWFWAGSFAVPSLFLINKNTRSDIGIIATLWGEAVLLNAGLTSLTKHSFKRARPFVYNPNVSAETKIKKSAQTSFFSGHTSMTAANTFFAAKVFSDYYPNSKWKPVIWGLAASIPAVTGYLRVAGGKHYLTDVITGYAVGAAIGYLVPHFHKRKKKDKGLSIYGNTNGVLLSYKF